MKKGIFSPKALLVIFASGAILFAISILLHAYDDTPEHTGRRSSPSSFSSSALGYAGFHDVLLRMGKPVERSSGNTLGIVGGRGTLIVAEPNLSLFDDEDGKRLLTVPRLLFVLPKWRGKQDQRRPAWLESVDPVSLGVVRRTLGLVSVQADVFRTVWPQDWAKNEVGIAPTQPPGSDVVQLIRSRTMRPIVGNEEGMLVGEIAERGRRIWVLADPDILANHGIGKGKNAAFMIKLVDELRFWNNRSARSPIVFDETVHGYRESENSIIKLMFRFPFVVVTLLLVASGAMLLLAGSTRFGPPQRPRPLLDFGKSGLIRNSARLIDYAGYQEGTLRRYVLMQVRLVAQALHAPSNLNEVSLAAWLDRIGTVRGVTVSCTTILRRAAKQDGLKRTNLPRLFDCARAIYKWKGEILHGPAKSRQHRQHYQK